MAEGERLSNSSAIPRSPLLSSDDSGTHKSTTETTTRRSPPKAIVDSSPLQAAMGKNKESLKVKLMVRRPITQLVEQGIMPPLKTSPALHEQRKQLERAKTGDLLKAKIQQRPDRQELERRHILEHEESHVDPSLAEKQRMLKKARLADQLNSQISHRPGPLELIKKNILHTEEPIERIVKEGLVSFKATSEGLLNRPQHPSSYITFEEDSQSSEGDLRCSPSRQDVLEAAAASAGIVTVALTIPTNEGSVVVTTAPILQPPLTAKLEPPTRIASPPYIPPPPPLPPPPAPPAVVIKTEPVQQQQQQQIHHHHHHQLQSDTSHLFAELCQSVIGNSSLISLTSAPSPVSLGSSISTLSPLSSVASPPNLLSRSSQSPLQQSQSQCQKSDAPGKDKNRKKNKSKPVAKARTIKFHEYKGPPNAQKCSGSSLTPVETSYELLLKQQNFLLEYLEGLHKHPTILPAPPKSNQSELSSSFAVQNNAQFNQPLPSPAPSVCSSVPNSPAPSYADSISSEITRLEKMKVSDLKLLLKQRNLPVSGPKPQLIERLKQVLPLEFADTSASESISGETCDLEAINSPRVSMSPESENEQMDIQQVDSPVSHYHHQQQVATPPQPSPEDLLREQQRKIDELQRKLRESQEELLQMKQHQLGSDQPVNQKLIVKQQLEAKIHKEKLQQLENQARLQKEHVAFQLSQQNLQNQQNLAVAAAAAAAAATASIKQQPLLAPKKEENCTFLFGDQQMQLTTTHKKQPVEIVWNGNSPLFLLGVQDSKKLLASQQHRTAASMPQIVLPITTATAHPMEAIIEKASFQTQLQQQQHPIQLQQQQQRQQPAPPPPQPMQIVQIDVQQPQVQQVQQVAAPQPPPLQQQPPPPQYEEATKELENNRKQKETSSKKSSHIKSNTVTDVLEILIKNGELPESAVHDPTTPTTPAITMQQQPTLVYAATSVAPHTVEIAHIQRSSPAPSPQRAIEKPSVSQYNEKICSPLMLDTSLQTHNVEMISPVESEVKTLDILLGQAQKSTSNSGGGGGNSTLSLDHEHRNEDINQFDPMELMELMGHPLDMDIGDEGCHSYVLDKQELGMGTMHSVRDMNPSLQPSLNDLIMQQQQQQQHQPHSQSSSYSSDYNQNSINCGGHSNNNYISSPMDVEDFENSLSSFDFSTIADVHDNQVNHNSSDPFGQLSQQSSLQNGGVDQNSYDSHLSMNHDNILDFFNIDDLKMTGDTVAWGEVDFAV